ncbi:MAG TPA: hypothetical protein VKR54_03100 [Candidatus Babeliales bacterium]|jgi:hypothetical protein|nr:hypothetical protein [Candidatus Babeliales bacterium]
MKKIQVLYSLLFASITMYCMEDNKKTELWQSINYKKIEASFRNDYKNYLKKHLEEYKTQHFTHEKMDYILSMGNLMTGHDCVADLHCTQNEDKNGFLQCAIKKVDLPVVQWLIAHENVKYHSPTESINFVTLCTEQLLPDKPEAKRTNAYTILKTITEPYKTSNTAHWWREFYIKKIIELQLEHKKKRTNFTIDEALVTPFLQQDSPDTDAPIFLSNMYQQVVEKESGNTLSHIIVNNHDADELYKLIHKDYVSSIENKDGMTTLDLAFKQHSASTQNVSLLDLEPEVSRLNRCCYFMLLKYIKSKKSAQEFDDAPNCCERHTITWCSLLTTQYEKNKQNPNKLYTLLTDNKNFFSHPTGQELGQIISSTILTKLSSSHFIDSIKCLDDIKNVVNLLPQKTDKLNIFAIKANPLDTHYFVQLDNEIKKIVPSLITEILINALEKNQEDNTIQQELCEFTKFCWNTIIEPTPQDLIKNGRRRLQLLMEKEKQIITTDAQQEMELVELMQKQCHL